MFFFRLRRSCGLSSTGVTMRNQCVYQLSRCCCHFCLLLISFVVDFFCCFCQNKKICSTTSCRCTWWRWRSLWSRSRSATRSRCVADILTIHQQFLCIFEEKQTNKRKTKQINKQNNAHDPNRYVQRGHSVYKEHSLHPLIVLLNFLGKKANK